MCTVVIRVPEDATQPIRLLAVRDEDPTRPWNPLGAWWPTRPGVVGVQDRLAGGAWLAARQGHLAVLLNREGTPDLPVQEIGSRGAVVLEAVDGRPPVAPMRTLGFNLVDVDQEGARLVSWDGRSLAPQPMAPGTHMIAHGDLDDRTTPRIVAWRDAFAAAPTDGGDDDWWRAWVAVLEQSAALPASDDRAIIRDNRAHGYPTQSLLACVATISPGQTDVRYAQLQRAGEWSPLDFER